MPTQQTWMLGRPMQTSHWMASSTLLWAPMHLAALRAISYSGGAELHALAGLLVMHAENASTYACGKTSSRNGAQSAMGAGLIAPCPSASSRVRARPRENLASVVSMPSAEGHAAECASSRARRLLSMYSIVPLCPEEAPQ